jgi:hypothetical protein
MSDALIQLFPFIIIGIAGAFGSYFIAKRLGRHKYVWVILTLIPVVNIFFFFYVQIVVVCAVLDKLKALQDALDNRLSPAKAG